MVWKLIAGQGELGSINWGANFNQTPKTLQKWLKKLKAHLNETVLLTGGGGHQTRKGTLKSVKIVKYDRFDVVRVKLSDLVPELVGMTEFEPYIGSWQISVWQNDKET